MISVAITPDWLLNDNIVYAQVHWVTSGEKAPDWLLNDNVLMRMSMDDIRGDNS